MENQINQQILTDVKQVIEEAIGVIETNTPWRIVQTPEQRKGGMHLGDKSFGFADKVEDYMVQNPGLVPAYIDVEAFKNDVAIVRDLQKIIRRLAPLTQSLEDTVSLAGQEAMVSAIAFYGAVKAAAKNNVPGAQVIYDDLKQRYTNSGRKPANDPANP